MGLASVYSIQFTPLQAHLILMLAERTISLRTLSRHPGTLADTALRLADYAATHGPTRLVIPVNGQVFVLAHEQAPLADVIRRAEDVVLDGISVHTAVRMLGDTTADRVPGVDLMMQLCRDADTHALRVMMLGGRPGAGDNMQTLLRRECPHLTVGVHCPPMGFEKTPDGIGAVTHAIRAFGPDVIFVAFGAPKQELFMDRHIRPLGVPVAMAVGGSFEMLSGMVTRAPKWMQDIGMEWFFRMVTEPRRLLWRYVSTNSAFLWIFFCEMLQGKTVTSQ